MNKATRIELVFSALHNAQKMIELAYKPKGKEFCQPIDDITDKKIRDYYYEINTMCLELLDRNVMDWQRKHKEQ